MSDICYPRSVLLFIKILNAASTSYSDKNTKIMDTVLYSPKNAHLWWTDNDFKSNLGVSVMEGLGGGPYTMFKGSQ